MSAKISIQGLHKVYGGVAAVDGLSIDIPAGSIYGLLGTNGAGKTTTFKCLLNLARPTSGSVFFDDRLLAPAMFESISYVPERSALYDKLSGQDHVEWSSRAFRRFDAKRAANLIRVFDIDMRKPVVRLSKGQRSAVALILAFSTRPEILVLDEPSAGLDPVHQRHVLDLMVEAAGSGATILFSSHQIGQVERATDRVAIMNRGKLVVQGEVEALKRDEKIIEATYEAPAPSFPELERDPLVRRVDRVGRLLRAYVRNGGNGVVQQLERTQPKSLRVLDQNLEDIFLAAVGGVTPIPGLGEE